MQSLDVILRTCDRVNVHNDWRQRYCGLGKKELLLGCVKSLVRSINSTKNHDISLTVLDDHSSDDTKQRLMALLEHVPNSKFVSLTESGYNHSAHQQWLLCRDSNADLVYSVEDDYLHCSTAVQEMLDSFDLFCSRLKHSNVVLYPFDHPAEYNPPAHAAFVVHGSARHWRTGFYTTNVIMTRPMIFQQHWQRFETLALKYNGDYLNPRTEHFDESNTIQPIWEQGLAVRFNPIPSLALHMQFELERDPWIDWQQWWKDYNCDDV